MSQSAIGKSSSTSVLRKRSKRSVPSIDVDLSSGGHHHGAGSGSAGDHNNDDSGLSQNDSGDNLAAAHVVAEHDDGDDDDDGGGGGGGAFILENPLFESLMDDDNFHDLSDALMRHEQQWTNLNPLIMHDRQQSDRYDQIQWGLSDADIVEQLFFQDDNAKDVTTGDSSLFTDADNTQCQHTQHRYMQGTQHSGNQLQPKQEEGQIDQNDSKIQSPELQIFLRQFLRFDSSLGEPMVINGGLIDHLVNICYTHRGVACPLIDSKERCTQLIQYQLIMEHMMSRLSWVHRTGIHELEEHYSPLHIENPMSTLESFKVSREEHMMLLSALANTLRSLSHRSLALWYYDQSASQLNEYWFEQALMKRVQGEDGNATAPSPSLGLSPSPLPPLSPLLLSDSSPRNSHPNQTSSPSPPSMFTDPSTQSPTPTILSTTAGIGETLRQKMHACTKVLLENAFFVYGENDIQTAKLLAHNALFFVRFLRLRDSSVHQAIELFSKLLFTEAFHTAESVEEMKEILRAQRNKGFNIAMYDEEATAKAIEIVQSLFPNDKDDTPVDQISIQQQAQIDGLDIGIQVALNANTYSSRDTLEKSLQAFRMAFQIHNDSIGMEKISFHSPEASQMAVMCTSFCVAGIELRILLHMLSRSETILKEQEACDTFIVEQQRLILDNVLSVANRISQLTTAPLFGLATHVVSCAIGDAAKVHCDLIDGKIAATQPVTQEEILLLQQDMNALKTLAKRYKYVEERAADIMQRGSDLIARISTSTMNSCSKHSGRDGDGFHDDNRSGGNGGSNDGSLLGSNQTPCL